LCHCILLRSQLRCPGRQFSVALICGIFALFCISIEGQFVFRKLAQLAVYLFQQRLKRCLFAGSICFCLRFCGHGLRQCALGVLLHGGSVCLRFGQHIHGLLPQIVSLNNRRHCTLALLKFIAQRSHFCQLLWQFSAEKCQIVNLGSVLDKATSRALAHCDVVVVVVEAERLCLVLAQVLLEKIGELDAAPADVRLVLVQRFESDAAYSRVEVEELLGHELAGVIKPAPGILRQAAERGEPFVLAYPESEIAGQIRALSRALLA